MKPEPFLILKTLYENFIIGVCYRSSSSVLRLDGNYLKIYPGHLALLTDNFFFNAILRGSFPT